MLAINVLSNCNGKQWKGDIGLESIGIGKGVFQLAQGF